MGAFLPSPLTLQSWLPSADGLNQVSVLSNLRALLTILLFIFHCLFSVPLGLFQTACHPQFLTLALVAEGFPFPLTENIQALLALKPRLSSH